MSMNIMALDLAKLSGYAIGEVGQKFQPSSGVVSFGGDGASHGAIMGNAISWLSETIRIHEPKIIVFEAPLPTGFKVGFTNSDTTAILHGLIGVTEGVAHLRKVYDVRKAGVSAVRNHFIGGNPKRDEAKLLTKRQCRAMGWDFEDDNEADALAIWHYMCRVIDPKNITRPTPLFLKPKKVKQ